MLNKGLLGKHQVVKYIFMFNKHYYIVENGNRMLCKYSGILKDKIIDNKLTHVSNGDGQNDPCYRLKLLWGKFGN